MNKMNYQKKLDHIISNLGVRRPTLLLHSCCAPCSSYCLEYLSKYFDITVLYYNPNMDSGEEYEKRAMEQQRLVEEMKPQGVKVVVEPFGPEDFYKRVKGLEDQPEGGKRCYVCYGLRMEKAAIFAKEGGFDFFTTTLSISPLKNVEWINDIGKRLEVEYGVKHLPSDFKKLGGYQRSIELSREYELYRQDFCGCIFSKKVK